MTLLNASLNEQPEATAARLQAVARAEAAAAVASGEADAVGLTGSLSTGRLWPSSDLDILLPSDLVSRHRFRWTVREGVVIHGVLTPWEPLEALRTGYPDSFINTAKGEWILDAVWALDGLLQMVPLHDPEGRLAALRAFAREHRFASEVVEPRRPLLLDVARRGCEGAAARIKEGKPEWARWSYRQGFEALGFLWLEAGRRITSHKELDPVLGEIGVALGEPGLQQAFRRTAGVEGCPERGPAIRDAFAELLRLYSPALDSLLKAGEPANRTLAVELPDFVYARHQILSVAYAVPRGCWLHLAGLAELLDEAGVAEINFAWLARAAARTGAPGIPEERALLAARDRARTALALAPWEDRLAGLRELIALSERRFGT